MKTAQEQHLDFKTIMIIPDPLEQHKAIVECWKTQFSYRKVKAKHRNHFTRKYPSSNCSVCNIHTKIILKSQHSFNLNYE